MLTTTKTSIKQLLKFSITYNFFQKIVGAESSRKIFVDQYLQPSTRMRVLDIGCGTAEILAYLPQDTHYVGFDGSEEYIRAAKERFGDRGHFFNAYVTDVENNIYYNFNVVIAIGVLHHLDDSEVEHLVAVAESALCENGRFVALDCCFVEGQNIISRWLIQNDRGKHVRSPEKYKKLVGSAFKFVESFHRNDFLRIPFDYSILVCQK